MKYQIAKQIQANLEIEYKAASKAVIAAAGERSPNCLVSDTVKFSSEYKAFQKQYDTAFRSYRNINSYINKMFKKEEAAARKEKMAARQAV